MRQSTISLVFFLRNISHPISSNLHTQCLFEIAQSCSLCGFCSKLRYPPPPPPPHTHTYSRIYTYQLFSRFYIITFEPSFFRSGISNPSYPTNTSNPVYCSWLPHNNVYNQLYTFLPASLPLASAYILYSVVRSFEVISIYFFFAMYYFNVK